ncbi:hypothetical protein [Kitasatospora cineracea]|uniref:Uncharacterized protein n=1 Tax=Kitasatospora cineracea TaxID=88074 RepID=A0A8G1UM24_9ACTN|nr:hypothetical protein [Kitasatospora cineracea]ROR46570.1 hypothetical protein EDD39_4852 [Kitasatospora cineracea]
MATFTRTLLFAAELVEEDGAHILLDEDVPCGTIQSIPVSKGMVDKLPVYLSALVAKLNPPSQGCR